MVIGSAPGVAHNDAVLAPKLAGVVRPARTDPVSATTGQQQEKDPGLPRGRRVSGPV